MDQATRIFLDTEFTGLHQSTSLISIALVAETGEEFYGECSDYDETQVFPWLKEHVLPKMILNSDVNRCYLRPQTQYVNGERLEIKAALEAWLKTFLLVEIWADVLAYDWVLFCELFGGALSLPGNVFYAPFDLATLFRVKGLIVPKDRHEQDVKRFEFAGVDPLNQHIALWDARVESICFMNLNQYDSKL